MNEPFVPTPASDDLDGASASADSANHTADHAVDDFADTTEEAPTPEDGEPIDLDAIERDLTDVQTALERLNDGSYWTDEITGGALPDEVLATFPLTRTVAGNATI